MASRSRSAWRRLRVPTVLASLVIDDVLYQGYSFFRVFEFLRAEGASTIRSAVLADRCCARVPILADVIGVRLQIAPGDVVECSVPPYEGEFAVDVLRPD